MHLKLFVDVLSDDGNTGLATNHFMMSRNAYLLKLFLEKDFKQKRIIAQAGRYVCCLMFDRLNESSMFFMDFKKDKELALYASKQYVDPYTQQTFMDVFEKVSKEYDEKYNEVELVIDRNFVPNIIKN